MARVVQGKETGVTQAQVGPLVIYFHEISHFERNGWLQNHCSGKCTARKAMSSLLE